MSGVPTSNIEPPASVVPHTRQMMSLTTIRGGNQPATYRPATDVDDMIKSSRRITIVDPITASRQRQAKATKIIHQEFLNMAMATNDPYWKKILLNAAKNKFISGFSYIGSRLTYIHRGRTSNKTSEITLTDNVEQDFDTVISFFRTMAGLRSDLDKVRERKQMEENQQLQADTVNLKKSTVKRELINKFIKRMTKEYNLTKGETKDLKNLIAQGFIMKTIQTSSIIIEDRQISSIVGLSYDPQTRKFTLPKSGKSSKKRNSGKNQDYAYLDPNHKRSAIKTKPHADKIWDKWIKITNKLTRQLTKNNQTGRTSNRTNRSGRPQIVIKFVNEDPDPEPEAIPTIGAKENTINDAPVVIAPVIAPMNTKRSFAMPITGRGSVNKIQPIMQPITQTKSNQIAASACMGVQAHGGNKLPFTQQTRVHG